MSRKTHFNRKLDDLWRRRTAELRAIIVPRGQGHPRIFTKRIRQRYIDDLLETASTLLLKRAGRSDFDTTVTERRLRQIRGHGLINRGEHLLTWAEASLTGPIVYVFWRKKKCLYVGKGAGWWRLKHYAKSAYLLQATCLEVFVIRSESLLAKAECLATHLFKPRDNKAKPSKVKWGKACPICKKHDQVRDQLRTLFKMK